MNNKNIGLTIGLIVIILLALLLFFGQKSENKKENDVNNSQKQEVDNKKEEEKAEKKEIIKTVNEEKEEKLDKKNKKEGIKTEKNKTYTTKSGLKYEIIKLGTGEKPKATDTVEVHYHGTLEDGTVFDSSVNRGKKASFGLNQVIAGWTEGLQLMPVGSKFKFTIPADLAYGQKTICWSSAELNKQKEKIPKEAFIGEKCTFKNPQTGKEEPGEVMVNPRATKLSGKTLIFEVELFSIKK